MAFTQIPLLHAVGECEHCVLKSAPSTQVWNAINRYSIDMSKYPAIKAVYENCVREAAVTDAAPDKQPDYTG